MKLIFFTALIITLTAFTSCKNKKNIPDVSAIKIDLKVERFEKDFYSLDTNNLVESLDILNQKYQSFLPDYLYTVLALVPQQDSVIKDVKLFLKDDVYRNIYNDATKKFTSFDKVKDELVFALNPTIQGDTTIYYIQKKLAAQSCRITTIARGIAFGGELEYADEMTLGKSISNRQPIGQYIK